MTHTISKLKWQGAENFSRGNDESWIIVSTTEIFPDIYQDVFSSGNHELMNDGTVGASAKRLKKTRPQARWSWAGHLARRGDGRCKAVTECPRTGKKSIGHPAARWADDIIAIANIFAQDRGS